MSGAGAQEFSIRPATIEDIPTLARHRCAMFTDMGQLPADDYPALYEATAAYFAAAMPAGDYVAWVVTPAEHPDHIVAGGGMQIRPALPRPARGGGGIQPAGPQGLIVNVYTDPEWRRVGLADLVMRTILGWCRAHDLVGVTLHASEMGRPLYERLGFTATNEMRFPL